MAESTSGRRSDIGRKIDALSRRIEAYTTSSLIKEKYGDSINKTLYHLTSAMSPEDMELLDNEEDTIQLGAAEQLQYDGDNYAEPFDGSWASEPFDFPSGDVTTSFARRCSKRHLDDVGAGNDGGASAEDSFEPRVKSNRSATCSDQLDNVNKASAIDDLWLEEMSFEGEALHVEDSSSEESEVTRYYERTLDPITEEESDELDSSVPDMSVNGVPWWKLDRPINATPSECSDLSDTKAPPGSSSSSSLSRDDVTSRSGEPRINKEDDRLADRGDLDGDTWAERLSPLGGVVSDNKQTRPARPSQLTGEDCISIPSIEAKKLYFEANLSYLAGIAEQAAPEVDDSQPDPDDGIQKPAVFALEPHPSDGSPTSCDQVVNKNSPHSDDKQRPIVDGDDISHDGNEDDENNSRGLGSAPHQAVSDGAQQTAVDIWQARPNRIEKGQPLSEIDKSYEGEESGVTAGSSADVLRLQQNAAMATSEVATTDNSGDVEKCHPPDAEVSRKSKYEPSLRGEDDANRQLDNGGGDGSDLIGPLTYYKGTAVEVDAVRHVMDDDEWHSERRQPEATTAAAAAEAEGDRGNGGKEKDKRQEGEQKVNYTFRVKKNDVYTFTVPKQRLGSLGSPYKPAVTHLGPWTKPAMGNVENTIKHAEPDENGHESGDAVQTPVQSPKAKLTNPAEEKVEGVPVREYGGARSDKNGYQSEIRTLPAAGSEATLIRDNEANKCETDRNQPTLDKVRRARHTSTYDRRPDKTKPGLIASDSDHVTAGRATASEGLLYRPDADVSSSGADLASTKTPLLGVESDELAASRTCSALATSTALVRRALPPAGDRGADDVGSVVSAVARAEASADNPYIAVARASARAASVATASATNRLTSCDDVTFGVGDINVVISTTCTIRLVDDADVRTESAAVLDTVDDYHHSMVHPLPAGSPGSRKSKALTDASTQFVETAPNDTGVTKAKLKITVENPDAVLDGRPREVRTLECDWPVNTSEADVTNVVRDALRQILESNCGQSARTRMAPDKGRQEPEVDAAADSRLSVQAPTRDDDGGSKLTKRSSSDRPTDGDGVMAKRRMSSEAPVLPEPDNVCSAPVPVYVSQPALASEYWSLAPGPSEPPTEETADRSDGHDSRSMDPCNSAGQTVSSTADVIATDESRSREVQTDETKAPTWSESSKQKCHSQKIREAKKGKQHSTGDVGTAKDAHKPTTVKKKAKNKKASKTKGISKAADKSVSDDSQLRNDKKSHRGVLSGGSAEVKDDSGASSGEGRMDAEACQPASDGGQKEQVRQKHRSILKKHGSAGALDSFKTPSHDAGSGHTASQLDGARPPQVRTIAPPDERKTPHQYDEPKYSEVSRRNKKSKKAYLAEAGPGQESVHTDGGSREAADKAPSRVSGARIERKPSFVFVDINIGGRPTPKPDFEQLKARLLEARPKAPPAPYAESVWNASQLIAAHSRERILDSAADPDDPYGILEPIFGNDSIRKSKSLGVLPSQQLNSGSEAAFTDKDPDDVSRSGTMNGFYVTDLDSMDEDKSKSMVTLPLSDSDQEESVARSKGMACQQIGSKGNGKHLSENELRISRSLSKLSIPDWFVRSPRKDQEIVILRNANARDVVRPWQIADSATSSSVTNVDSRAAAASPRPVVIHNWVSSPYAIGSALHGRRSTSPQSPADRPFELPSARLRSRSQERLKPVLVRRLDEIPVPPADTSAPRRPAKEAYLQMRERSRSRDRQADGGNASAPVRDLSDYFERRGNMAAVDTDANDVVSRGTDKEQSSHDLQHRRSRSRLPYAEQSQDLDPLNKPVCESGCPRPPPKQKSQSTKTNPNNTASECLRKDSGLGSSSSSSPHSYDESGIQNAVYRQLEEPIYMNVPFVYQNMYNKSDRREQMTQDDDRPTRERPGSQRDLPQANRSQVNKEKHIDGNTVPLPAQACRQQSSVARPNLSACTEKMDALENDNSIPSRDSGTSQGHEEDKPWYEEDEGGARRTGTEYPETVDITEYDCSPGSRRHSQQEAQSTRPSEEQTSSEEQTKRTRKKQKPRQNEKKAKRPHAKLPIASTTNQSFENLLDGLLVLDSPPNSMINANTSKRPPERKNSVTSLASQPMAERLERALELLRHPLDSGVNRTNEDENQSPKLQRPLTADESQDEDLATLGSGKREVVVKCRNKKCRKAASLEEARKNYKTCHNCYTYYCSRQCRKDHWTRHKRKCLYSRISSACKHVARLVHDDPELCNEFTRVARAGYLSRGRGCVLLAFPSTSEAERFLQDGLQGTDVWPAYATIGDLQDVDTMGEHLFQLIDMCRSYNPEVKFVLEVAIVTGGGEVPPSRTIPKRECSLIQICYKLRLSSASIQNPPTAASEADTLILTALPGSELTENLTGKKAREICFVNIQRKLRQRGVSLRHHFPEVYSRLCAYVADNEHFTPITIFPMDTKTGKRFMCLIMPDSEPDVDWIERSDLLEQLGLSTAV